MIFGFDLTLLPLSQANFSGGVGNIVAAALETKGLIDQATILVTFKEQLEWIAAAAWLFSICMGIGAAAVFGNYRQGTYLLLGPPLFYYMITTTIPTDGAKAIFGDREVAGSIEDQKKLLDWVRTIGEGNETVEVSFFFGVFDSIVTEVVQSVVAFMLDTDNRADLRYVARESVLSQVMLSISDDRELGRLVLTYHAGQCGEDMSMLQAEMERKEKVNVRLRPADTIDNASNKVLNHEWSKPSVAVDPDVKRYIIGLKDTAQSQGIEIPYKSETDETIVSCEQIWNFTRVALYEYAKTRLTLESLQESASNLSETDIPLSEALQDVRTWLEFGGKIDAAKVLAAFIYKNTLTKMTPSALQGQLYGRTPVNSEQFEAVFGSLGNSEAHGGYMKIKYFSRAIPYLQGLLLYLLAIAFPFFAIFLVLPGKATTFLAWCSLWAWVKSWDIGFALVYVGRDIFWHMMKQRVNIHGTELEWSGDPSSIIRFAYQNDPLLSQNTYWVITSALTMMVPLVTAHLALGATGMWDMFKGSVDKTATRFSQTEGNAGRRHEANISESMMDRHQALVRQEGARSSSRDDGAQLLNGTNSAPQDKRKGMLYGAFSQNEQGQWGPTKGVTDARVSEAVASGQDFVTTMQLGSKELLSGGREAGVQAAANLEKQNKAANAANPNADLPEVIPQADRGMARMNEPLDEQSMKDYVSSNREMASLYRQYGRNNDAVRHERRANEIQGKIGKIDSGQTITRGEYFSHEQKTSNAIQDRLVTESRRRQYRQKTAAGRAALSTNLTKRQGNALNAQHYFDVINQATTYPLPGIEGHLVNPTGGGLKLEFGKANFTSGSAGNSVGGDQDADGGE